MGSYRSAHCWENDIGHNSNISHIWGTAYVIFAMVQTMESPTIGPTIGPTISPMIDPTISPMIDPKTGSKSGLKMG